VKYDYSLASAVVWSNIPVTVAAGNGLKFGSLTSLAAVIGILREKQEFLRHIQPAIKSLIEVASIAEDFNFLAEFLISFPDRPKPRIRLA